MLNTIKNWAINIAFEMLWRSLGRVLVIFEDLVTVAESDYKDPAEKLDYVKREAKKRFPELGEWMLNLLSELAVGKVKGKLSIPRKLRIRL